jgi:ornithine cyclodeaminase/alanine dehydrogenase-like protein (mu-crystallin family)
MISDVAIFPDWADAMLTTAVSATGIKFLSPINSHSLGIIGTGG